MDVGTAILPAGWRERVIAYAGEAARSAVGICLDPHDLAISKLAAGREKDYTFVWALLCVHLLDGTVLLAHAGGLADPIRRGTVLSWIEAAQRRLDQLS